MTFCKSITEFEQEVVIAAIESVGVIGAAVLEFDKGRFMASIRPLVLALLAAERERCAEACRTTYARNAFHFELGLACVDSIQKMEDPK